PLGFVDRRGIRQHQFIQLAEPVAHLPTVECDDELTFLLFDASYDADVAVVDLTVVVVLDLHDLVARTVGRAEAFDPRLARRVQRPLQLNVQRSRTNPAAVHRTEHLNIADRIQPERLRNALVDYCDDLAYSILGSLSIDEVEIRQRSTVGQLRH